MEADFDNVNELIGNMEVQESGNDILRAIRPQGKKRPATYFGEPSSFDDYGEDLRKSLQVDRMTQKLSLMGDTKIGSLTGDTNRRMSLQLEKQLMELSAMSGNQPVTIGDQTAMISCWNSVHGKPDADKSPDKTFGSRDEIGKENMNQSEKKPLERTASDEIRQALKQKHVQSMERALLRRNSGSVTMATTSVNKQSQMGTRSMSMVFPSRIVGGPNIGRSMSVVAANSDVKEAVLQIVKTRESSLLQESKLLKEEVDENSNLESDLVSVGIGNDTYIAARQSSYPGAQGVVHSAADKRSSAPILDDSHKRVRFTIEPQGETKDEVPELFKCIRGATQRDLFEEMDHREPAEHAKAFYEVMYVGRAKVKGKKITSAHVDDLVIRLEAKEEENRKKTLEEKVRKRHASDTSIKSLPNFLEGNIQVTENELQKQHGFKGVELHNLESPSGSSDEILQHGDTAVSRAAQNRSPSLGHSGDNLSDSSSSSENVLERRLSRSSDTLKISHSGDQLKDIFSTLHPHPEGEGHIHDNEGQSHFLKQSGVLIKSANRTMLFSIGHHAISLISLDKKQTIIERNFKDISSVSQGNVKNDVFGFISREPSQLLVCHLLRCHSGSVVDEIMVTLRTSFQSLYEQTKQQGHQVCINCPLHQYHKLCEDITGLTPEIAYNLLCRRIQQLPEKEATDLFHCLQTENPQCFEESVEVLMIALRRMAEHKQREHSHISDGGKGAHRSDFILIDMKGKLNTSAFDAIRNRAKKKLTNSFESLLTKAHHNIEDVKEAFRHRSSTVDNEDALHHSTPEISPAQSPANPNKNISFTFDSPPDSPRLGGRPRSATVGAISDTGAVERLAARHEEKKKAEQKEQAMRRASASPMKHMFIMANSNSSPVHDVRDKNLLSLSDGKLPKHRRLSWRQEIFNRVVTPSRHPHTPSVPEIREESFVNDHELTKRSSEEIRALWKKAILETLLLIRMEKENSSLIARQDEMHLKRQKLDYQEITPCLKEVSKVWEEMLQTPNRDQVMFDSQKLLSCVKQGVPQAKRGEIWWFLVEQHRLKYPSIAEQAPQVEYSELLKQLTTHQHAILIDLGRTFPGHPYFSMQLGNGQLALFNLLKAYSLMDQDVGYCQGLSFVAGILLMHMEERQAFDTWKHVMFNLGLRKQYKPNMIALQIQLYQLTRLIHDNYKDLYDHFEFREIAPTLYAAPWFLTLFASQFPLGFVARVFDLLFIQGVDVIFKVALVLLGNHKELIMQCESFESIVEFIKTTLPEMGMIQMERVINQVFDMDISKPLQAYEVEYHVLKEEMMYSPQKGENDLIQKLEQANHSLKQQNMELIEKLQHAHSHERSLEGAINNFQTQEAKLKSHIRALELERAALLNAVAKLKHLIPESDQLTLDLSLPDMSPNMAQSPGHQQTVVRDITVLDNGCDGELLGDKQSDKNNCASNSGTTRNGDESVNLTEKRNSANTKVPFDITKSARYHPERDS